MQKKLVKILIVILFFTFPLFSREITFYDDDINIDGGYFAYYPIDKAFVGNESSQQKRGIFSLKISLAPERWSGVEIGLSPVNIASIRNKGALTFWIRSETKEEKNANISVYIMDSRVDGLPFRTSVSLSRYCELKDEWQFVAIPLSDFKDNGSFWDEAAQTQRSGQINWSDIAAVTFDIPPTNFSKNITFYIDDLKITSEEKSTRIPEKEISEKVVFFDDEIITGGGLYRYPIDTVITEITDADKYKGKYSLKGVFNPNRYSGIELTAPKGLNLSKIKETGALELWIKGSIPTPEFYIGLVNSRDSGNPVNSFVAVDKYIKIDKDKWQRLIIPLEDFPRIGTYWDETKYATIPGEFNWKDVIEIQLFAGPAWGGGESYFFIDDVKILPEYVPDTKSLSKKIENIKNLSEEVSKTIKKAIEKGKSADIQKAKELAGKGIEFLKKSKEFFKAGDNKNSFAQLKKAHEFLNKAYYNTFESKPVEGRAVWVQYWSLSSVDEIKRFVKELADTNFNMVIVESYILGGYTIWPTGVGKQIEQYKGWDPLKVLIEECHKYGIEVHTWFSIFRAGGNSPLFETHPDWIEWETPLSKFDPTVVYWICPARVEYREYVKKFIKELLDNYAIDGFHYDYIRYPESPLHSCFYCKDKFEKLTGINPWAEEIKQDTEGTMKWNIYREGLITEFVKDISTFIKEKKPEIYLSAAVWPRNQHGFLTNTVLQNWENWVDNQYIDFLCPMEYYNNLVHLKYDVDSTERRVNGRINLYHGLGQYMLANSFELLKQIEFLNDKNSDGTVLFALNSMDERFYSALKEGPFREKAISNHKREIETITRLIDEIKNKAEKLSDKKLIEELNELKVLAEKTAKNDFLQDDEKTKELKKAIKEIKEKIGKYKIGEIKKRYVTGILNDIKYFEKQLKTKIYNRKIIETTKEEEKFAIIAIPEITITRTDKAPVLDGVLDDSVWKQAARVTDFWYYDGTGKVSEENQTIALIIYDDKNIYFGIKSKKANPEYKIDAVDGGKTWEDDSIELFFDIEGKAKGFSQFGMNANGARFATTGKLDFKCKTKKTDTGWILEAALPFSALGKTPQKGEMWRVNICRNEYTLPTPHCGWSCTYGSFLTPSRFGKITFK